MTGEFNGYLALFNQLETTEIATVIAGLGIGGVFMVVVVLSYIVANLGNAVLFAIAPALWIVVKKMKASNAHGDAPDEFQGLNDGAMKILYASDTGFYLKYMDECEKLGIAPKGINHTV